MAAIKGGYNLSALIYKGIAIFGLLIYLQFEFGWQRSISLVGGLLVFIWAMVNSIMLFYGLRHFFLSGGWNYFDKFQWLIKSISPIILISILYWCKNYFQ